MLPPSSLLYLSISPLSPPPVGVLSSGDNIITGKLAPQLWLLSNNFRRRNADADADADDMLPMVQKVDDDKLPLILRII
jgi:hypothetical protein